MCWGVLVSFRGKAWMAEEQCGREEDEAEGVYGRTHLSVYKDG